MARKGLGKGTDLANIRSGYASAQITAMTENHSADTTYYLQKDGTVKSDATGRDDYVCKAGSEDAGTFDKIGGRLTAEWDKGDKITYKIVKDTNTVESIASPEN